MRLQSLYCEGAWTAKIATTARTATAARIARVAGTARTVDTAGQTTPRRSTWRRRNLAPDTLRAVIESFVLREGTDYGLHETSLDDKVAQVLGQLQRREAYVVFDPSSASVGIVVASAVPEAERTGRCRDSTSPGTKRF